MADRLPLLAACALLFSLAGAVLNSHGEEGKPTPGSRADTGEDGIAARTSPAWVARSGYEFQSEEIRALRDR